MNAIYFIEAFGIILAIVLYVAITVVVFASAAWADSLIVAILRVLSGLVMVAAGFALEFTILNALNP